MERATPEEASQPASHRWTESETTGRHGQRRVNLSRIRVDEILVIITFYVLSEGLGDI